MIQINELRVGNVVDKLFGGFPSEWHWSIFQPSEYTDLLKYPENYRPIPLTPEWLLKNTVVACAGKETEWYELSANGWLKVKPLEGSFFLFVGKEEVCEVTTVHRLQNIFFAITGRELKIITP